MLFYPTEKLALFIDGANLYGAAKGLQFDIDYKRLLELFARKGNLVRAFYYTAVAEDQEFSPLRPLVDWLDYNGFSVVTKPLKEFTDAQGRRRVKGNMDIELAIDVMEMAQLCRSCGDLFRRRRFPPPSGSGAAAGPAGQRGFHHPHPAAHGGGRTPPPGRQFHRAGRTEVPDRPRRRQQSRAAIRFRAPRPKARDRANRASMKVSRKLRRMIARSAPGWRHSAPTIAPNIPTGSTARCPVSGR